MDSDPYRPPQADLLDASGNQKNFEYAGFWLRVLASIIDNLLLMVIMLPLLLAIYGETYWESTRFVEGFWDVMISWVFPAVAIVLFWIYRAATPGKMALHMRIVDARTGAKLKPQQCVVRYLGYFVSIIPFMLGIIWVAFDKKKQGWHDKIAKTVVIRD